MQKATLLFSSLIDLARFAKVLSSGYLMNTNKFTITGKFTEEDIHLAVSKYKSVRIETTEKVFTY